jgi:hypothetical protein
MTKSEDNAKREIGKGFPNNQNPVSFLFFFRKKATPTVSFFVWPDQKATWAVSFFVVTAQKAIVVQSGF